MTLKKIIHLTSVHKRYDVRIFLKECVSLKNTGYDVTLIVADGIPDEVKSGVKIIDAGKKVGGRFNRMLNTTSRVFEKAVKENGDIYHFHDPELLPVGLKLKKLGKRVVFDSHENYSDDIKDKAYIHPFIRHTISTFYRIYERYAVKKIDAVITATPSIRDYFASLGVEAVDINNYPFIEEFDNTSDVENKPFDVVYVGGLAKIRGVQEVVAAIELTNNCSMVMAGPVEDDFLSELKGMEGWKNVTYEGLVSRARVNEIFSESKIAVVTFLPAPNHIESQPNKMFEYMSAGLPIICSNFPLWKLIVEGNNCGICVDPNSPEEIAKAITYLKDNPEEAKEMGRCGGQAIVDKYNWETEAKKLVCFYKKLSKKVNK